MRTSAFDSSSKHINKLRKVCLLVCLQLFDSCFNVGNELNFGSDLRPFIEKFIKKAFTTRSTDSNHISHATHTHTNNMIVFLDVKANEENCVLFFIKIKTTNYARGRIDYSWVVLTAREREPTIREREREKRTLFL